MKPAPFEYHAPDDLEAVLAALAALGDDAKVLAGGQSLVPMLNLRLARFGHLVDIGRVAELRGIERDNGSLVVKASLATTPATTRLRMAPAPTMAMLLTPTTRLTMFTTTPANTWHRATRTPNITANPATS